MDINAIINIVKNVPKDKWNDDRTIKKVIQSAAKQSGKTYTDDQLNDYVKQFKKLSQSSSPLSLIAMLLKKGVSKSQIDEIKRKMSK
jgi:uncharacterized protein YpuA (DUF1002 family)